MITWVCYKTTLFNKGFVMLRIMVVINSNPMDCRWLLKINNLTVDRFTILNKRDFNNKMWEPYDMGCPFFDY